MKEAGRDSNLKLKKLVIDFGALLKEKLERFSSLERAASSRRSCWLSLPQHRGVSLVAVDINSTI